MPPTRGQNFPYFQVTGRFNDAPTREHRRQGPTTRRAGASRASGTIGPMELGARPTSKLHFNGAPARHVIFLCRTPMRSRWRPASAPRWEPTLPRVSPRARLIRPRSLPPVRAGLTGGLLTLIEAGILSDSSYSCSGGLRRCSYAAPPGRAPSSAPPAWALGFLVQPLHAVPSGSPSHRRDDAIVIVEGVSRHSSMACPDAKAQ